MGITEAAQDISFQAMKRTHHEVLAIVMADPAVESIGSLRERAAPPSITAACSSR